MASESRPPAISLITKDNCFYCNKMKSLLRQYGLKWSESVIGRDVDREEVLRRFPDVRTVPIVEVGGVLVGTYEDARHFLFELYGPPTEEVPY